MATEVGVGSWGVVGRGGWCGVWGTGNRDVHAGVGPGSNTAKPEKDRETKHRKLDGPEDTGDARIHSGASSPPPDPYYLKVLCRNQR